MAASSFGLCCSLCRRFTCDLCLHSISKKFTKSDIAHNPWCLHISKYVSKGIIPHEPFIGHCCDFDTKQVKSDHISELSRKRSPLSFDGYLHIYECGLLLAPPLHGSIDVHAFGNDKSLHLAGLSHAVIDQELAKIAHKQNLHPDGSSCTFLNSPEIISITTDNLTGDGKKEVSSD